jgi:hypothetical protein
MDKKENIETAQSKERKSSRDWKESNLIFLVLPIIFIILFPLGGVFYLCGRFSPYAIALAHVCMLYPVIGVFIIYCFFAGIVRLLGGWRKHTRKRKLVIATKIAIPLVFIVLFLASCFTSIEGMIFVDKPFMSGFGERIRCKADIEAIRDWLKTLSKEDYTDHAIRLPVDKWSKSLKVLNPDRVYLSTDENDNPKVRLMWGSGFLGHWGVEIGMEDMEIPPSDFSQWGEYRIPLEPGAYVWHELQ